MRPILALITAFLFALSAMSYAADFGGIWQVNAGVFNGQLTIVPLNVNSFSGSIAFNEGSFDQISGTSNGNMIRFLRFLSSKGINGTQEFVGLLVNPNYIAGTWTGVGGNGPWSANRR